MERKVSIQVDRLVLEGVGAGDARTYGRALEAALWHQLSGATPRVSHAVRIDAGMVDRPQDGGVVGSHVGAILAGRQPGSSR